MSGIYIRDLDVILVEDRLQGTRRLEGTRRSLDVLLPILKLITPQGIVVINQWSTPLGTRIEFANEEDANLILNTRVIATLDSHNLKAQFSNATSFNRQVWLTDTPDSVYSKDTSILTDDIRQSTNIRVPILKKYENTSGRKYLIITTNSKTDRDSLLAQGHIQIADSRIKCEKTIQKPRQNSLHPSQRPTPSAHHPAGRGPAYQERHTRPSQHLQSHQSSTNHSNRWSNYDEHFPGLPPGTPHAWETQNRSTSTGNPRSLNPNGESVQPTFKNEHDLKFYVEASISICHKLSTGIEKPSEYVSVLNEMFRNKGLPTIDVPNHYLESSRTKFVQVNYIYDPRIPPPSLHPLPTSTPSMSATSHAPTMPTSSLASSMPISSLNASLTPSKSNTQTSTIYTSPISASSKPASPLAPSPPITRGKIAKKSVSLQYDSQNG